MHVGERMEYAQRGVGRAEKGSDRVLRERERERRETITESIHMVRDDIDRYLDNKSKRWGSVIKCILKCSLAAYMHAYLQDSVVQCSSGLTMAG